MAKIWLMLFCSIVLISGSIIPTSLAYFETTPWGVVIHSPREQIQSGIQPSGVTCWKNLYLMKNLNTNSTACVKSYTAQKLLERGWEVIHNPNSSWYLGQGEFMHVLRDPVNDTTHQYTNFTLKEIGAHTDLLDAMNVADLDYYNYLHTAKRTGCYFPTCTKVFYDPLEYYNTIDTDEAKRLITDLGFHDYPKVAGETKSNGHKLYMEFSDRRYIIDIVGVGTP